MPQVTLEQLFPATYVKAPVSVLTPNRPGWAGAKGTLGILYARYGSDESRTRQICVFLSESTSFITSPGIISKDGDLIVHTQHEKPKDGVLREPLRDDLTGEYINAWRLTGPEILSSQVRKSFLKTIKARWRVLRRTEMGEG